MTVISEIQGKKEWVVGSFSAAAQWSSWLLCSCFCPCLISIAHMTHTHGHSTSNLTQTHTGLKGHSSFELPPFVFSGSVCNYSQASDEQQGRPLMLQLTRSFQPLKIDVCVRGRTQINEIQRKNNVTVFCSHCFTQSGRNGAGLLMLFICIMSYSLCCFFPPLPHFYTASPEQLFNLVVIDLILC